MESLYKEIEEFIKEHFRTYFVEQDLPKARTFLHPELTVIGGNSFHEVFNLSELVEEYELGLISDQQKFDYQDLKIKPGYVSEDLALVNVLFTIQFELEEGGIATQSVRSSYTLKRSDNSWKVLHIHISAPCNNKEGKEMIPVRNLIEKNDDLMRLVDSRTSELLDLNSELEQAISSRDKLYSIIAHDLRGPFNSLIGLVDVLRSRFTEFSADQQLLYLDAVSQSSKKILGLLNDLLGSTNIQNKVLSYEPQRLDLDLIIGDTVALLKETAEVKSIGIKVTGEKHLSARGDKFMVSAIFRNLISNAIKFTPDNGEIQINAEYKADQDQRIIVSVRDNGVGFSPDQLATVFQNNGLKSKPGTNGEQGFGFGLKLCKEFITMHGTDIWVDSKAGKGSTISFFLEAL